MFEEDYDTIFGIKTENENKNQKEFRIMMNSLLATPPNQKHNFETKNFYKDYPCDKCGASDNAYGKTCWRYKATIIKNKFHSKLKDY